MALSAVSVAKAAVWLSLPKKKREAFSMRNIKLMYYNKKLGLLTLSAPKLKMFVYN